MNKKNIKTFILCLLDNKKLRQSLFLFSFLLLLGFILFLNIKTPLLGDDYTYRLIFDTSERVESFQDIVRSQITHYNIWGGRTVVHTIAQLLLLLPPLLMKAINSLAFLLFLTLIYAHINYKKPFSVSLLVGAFLLIWFLEPFAETILWITGSANYMWGCMIVLAFLLPYRLIEGNKGNKSFSNGIIQTILMLCAGVIAGWTNENIGAGLILMLILFFVYYRKLGVKIPVWAYVGLIGVLIGYMFMITAPGNTVRASNVSTGVFSVIYRLFRHTQTLFNYLGVLNMLYIILFVTIYRQNEENRKQILLKSLIYELGALASVYVMIFSPAFPERAWFGVIAFNIIAIGILLVNVENKMYHYFKYGFVVFGIFTFLLNTYDVLKDINYVEHTLKEREAYILEEKAKGEKVIYIDKYENKTKYSMPDPAYMEPVMPRYYGVTVKYREKALQTEEE